ncbi:hypothetical protein M2284_003462 [Rhodococcus sp. LBL1]|nr:hypothetical protein [Rhodococcus sp. LBL1]MDH6685014.1 hypothetical protein [Rhodococcus sp. LBL2]
MTTKHLSIVTTETATDAGHGVDDGRLPDDPAHPTIDNAPRYLIDTQRTFQLHHDARDKFEDVSATAVYIDDGFNGPILELGPWSMTPRDARLLGDALRELAAALDPRLA